MYWTFWACVGLAFVWMGLFYLWGNGFLTLIKAERDIASCVSFGYLLLQVVYQIIYLPFYFTRGSYRATSYIWMSVVVIISAWLLILLQKQQRKQTDKLNRKEKFNIVITIILILGLAFYIALHVPFYGQDTRIYISAMNASYYRDTIWVDEGLLHFDHGMCSMFQLFTIPSLFTGIRPYYISLFTVRIVGISLFSLVIYKIGNTVFKKGHQFSWPALVLSVLVGHKLNG